MPVLLVEVRACEASLLHLLDEHVVAGDEVLLRVAGVVDEGLVLADRSAMEQHLGGRQHTQSPPNILRAQYMPTAATKLGFTRMKRWSSKVISMRNLLSVRV